MQLRIKRQFNYTARVRIPKSDVKFSLWESPGAPPRIVVDDFGLSDVAVPHDPGEWAEALVVLEATRLSTSSFIRIPITSVTDIALRPAPQYSGSLEGFDSAKDIVFTVKVVSQMRGSLLAEAKGLRAEDNAKDLDELLPVRAVDLGQEPWRLFFEPDVGPILQVNKKLTNCDNFVTHNALAQGAVLPVAMRMVMHRLVQDAEFRESQAGRCWVNFASEFAASPMPEAEDGGLNWLQVDGWVNEIVSKYSSKFVYADRINDMLAAPSGDD